jgi:NADPH-dependent ferric siderophore reductase
MAFNRSAGQPLLEVPLSDTHAITRVRYQTRYRRLEVRRIESLTPRMRRIVLGGDELNGFTSLGFDDHVKLFFPDATGHLPAGATGDDGKTAFADGSRPASRDFTPRRYEPASRELTIDFSLHGAGPAATWAAAVREGSPLGVAGPRGSQVVSDTFDWNLLIGDETALPAIGRRLEELPSRVAAIVVVEVEEAAEQLPLDRPGTDVHWVYRKGGTPPLDQLVATLALPAGDGFAWVAGEAAMARRLRTHLIQQRGIDKAWVKAAAYWRIGDVGKHEVLAD